MRRCRQWLRAALVAWMFLLGVAAVAALMPLLEMLLGRRALVLNEAIVVGWNRAVCRILNLRLHVTGRPDPAARLLVANHVSWLDIIALGSQCPCLFVAKGEVADWPVVGYLAKGIGTLFVRRGDAGQSGAVAELMVWRLRQGRRVALFPEGTTTAGERVLRFHGKLFQPARRAGVAVQPAALRYTGEAARLAPFVGEDAFLPHLLRLLALERLDLELCFCPALPAGSEGGEMAAACRRRIVEALDPALAAPGEARAARS